MMRCVGFAALLASILLIAGRWALISPSLVAADNSPRPLPQAPYFLLFAASLDRLQEACDIVFDSVNRPDLSKLMGDRLRGEQDLTGIERTKPFGLMSTWDDPAQVDVLFIPVAEIGELLKTATFGVVPFHQVDPDHYEIERPGSPYHVLVRKDYAFLADSPETIRGLRVTPEQLTRRLRAHYDVALHLDLLQIPHSTKTKLIAAIRSQIEPWLQPRDDEAAEVANLRKTLGQLSLDLVERAVMDTRTFTIGARLDPKSKHFSLEIVVEAVPKSRMATGLNRLTSHRSEFAPLIQTNVPAGLSLNLPISGLVEQVLGLGDNPTAKGSRLEAAIQLVGTGPADLSLIAVLHGEDAEKLNAAIPQLLVKLEKSGEFNTIRENFDVHRGVVLHSLIPRELPTAITQWIGSDVEMIVGQGKQKIWLAIGQPTPLLDRLLESIDALNQAPVTRVIGPLVQGRFQAQKLPELVASDLLIPNSDTDAARQAFSDGEDGFNLTVEPIVDGLKLRLEFEEGFTRLIGQGWIRQFDIPSEN